MSVEPHLPPRTRKDDRIQWKVLGSANTTRYWRAAPRSDGHNLSSFRSKTPNRTKMLTNIVMVVFFGGGKKCLKWQKLDLRKRKAKTSIMIGWNLGSGKVYIFFRPTGPSEFHLLNVKFEKICLLVSSFQGSSQTAIREAQKPPSLRVSWV